MRRGGQGVRTSDGRGPVCSTSWPLFSPGGTLKRHVRCARTSRGGPRRALRHRTPGGCRWHGDRIPRTGSQARSRRRLEGAAPRARRRARDRALPEGDPGHRPPAAPAHPAVVRFRPGRRPDLLCDAARGRRIAAAPPRARETPPDRGGGRARQRRRQCARLRAPARRDPPRHQAGEHPVPGWRGGSGGLRHRARPLRRRWLAAHGNGPVPRHAAVHEPGTSDRGPPHRRAQRHLLPRRGPDEMLAGEPPHTGPTGQSVIAKVVTARPRPLRQLRESVPPHVDAAVLKALAKLPADRFQTAAQFVDALARPGWGGVPATTAPDPAAAAPERPGRRAVRDVAPLAVAAIATSLALWVSVRPRPEPPARPVARFTLVLPPSAPMSDFVGPTVALSPDGSRIVYVSSVATGSQLFSRRLDELEPAPLAGTQNARNPFFSPDGRSLAYFSGAKLYKLPLAGGPATLVADVPGLAFGATWGTTDTIVFRSDRGLMKVAAAGGEPRPLLPPDTSRGETYLFPQYLPDAKALLLQIRTKGVDRLGALTIATGKLTRFEQPGSNPRYVSSGFVVVATRSGTLLAVPFDASRLEITGPAVPVAEGVLVGPGGAARMGMSRDGAFAYVTGPLALRDLVIVDRAGRARVLPAEPQAYIAPRLSPDGRRIAVEVDEPDFVNSDVWL